MNALRLFALVGIFSFCVINQPTASARPEQTTLDEFQNYVVIGAFKYHRNAIRFTDHAHKDLSLNAHFELNPERNLYYVYVLSTNDRVQAISEALRLRSESEFTDTWVYSGALGKNGSALLGSNGRRGVDINPMTAQNIDDVSSGDHASESRSSELAQGVTDNSGNQNGNSNTQTTTEVTEKNSTISSAITDTSTKNDASGKDDSAEGKRFMFKIFRAVDNASIEGDVNVIDTDRSRKMAAYKGNMIVRVADPASKSDNVSMVCEVFGYRKVQRDLNYGNPEGEGIEKDEQGAVVIPFELVRLQRGDIAVMYNVYFFKDASIMRPESRFEVNSLMDMLNENPKYKIKIHGHTNGGAHGKIISMNKDSKNFFSLNDTKDGFGSAKQLSQERAEIIRDYLISNGIDPSRMQIKAWGGKRAIHDKHSTRAQENVRVEVEILEN